MLNDQPTGHGVIIVDRSLCSISRSGANSYLQCRINKLQLARPPYEAYQLCRTGKRPRPTFYENGKNWLKDRGRIYGVQARSRRQSHHRRMGSTTAGSAAEEARLQIKYPDLVRTVRTDDPRSSSWKGRSRLFQGEYYTRNNTLSMKQRGQSPMGPGKRRTIRYGGIRRGIVDQADRRRYLTRRLLQSRLWVLRKPPLQNSVQRCRTPYHWVPLLP